MTENPQKENGFTGIANELVEALCRTNLGPYESRVLWAVFRKTYGWDKKEDWISLSQLVELTGMSRPHICRAKKMLIDRKIIAPGGNRIGINKFYTQWRELPRGANNHHSKSLPPPATPLPRGVIPLPRGAHTTETNTTEPLQQKPSVNRRGPHPGVQAIISAMKETYGVLDDTETSNRRYAWLLLKKAEMNTEACVSLIRAAKDHPWWGTRITRVADIYRNAHKITNALKSEKKRVLIAD